MSSTTEIPSPHFDSFIVDISSRCDLACPGCSVYGLEDRGFEGLPIVPPATVQEQTADRINEHAQAHGLKQVTVVLFGGDPFIRGAGPVRSAVKTIRDRVDAEVNFRATTNGVRLGRDPELRETLIENRVHTGISLDGYPELHNTSRVDHRGRGTFDAVARGIEAFRTDTAQAGRPELYAGLLCTLIDPSADAERVLQTLNSFQPPRMDYSLDYGRQHTQPPHEHYNDRPTVTPYGDFLIHSFDAWMGLPEEANFPDIRLFNAIIRLHKGEESGSAWLGAMPWSTVGIGTDGAIRHDPSFNGAFDGAADTGVNVATHSFDDAIRYPSFARYQLGKAGLSTTCQTTCPIVDICGGGIPASRYYNPDPHTQPAHFIAEMFNYPSVYCGDLAKLITHIGGFLGELGLIEQQA